MVRCTLVLVLCALVSAALLPFGTASADPLVSVELTGAGTVSDSITINGTSETVYLGPYALSVAGGSAQPAFCFDAATNINIGDSWSANSTNDPAAAAGLWFPGDSAGLQKINMISWLATQAGVIADPVMLGALNEAMWEISADYTTGTNYITDAIPPLSGGKFFLNDDTYLNDAANFLTEAYAYRDDTVVGQSDFLTPDGCTNTGPCDQPFVSSVPEPATLLLLASGLVGMVGFVRKHGQI